MHGSRDVGIGLIRKIVRDLEISAREWNSL